MTSSTLTGNVDTTLLDLSANSQTIVVAPGAMVVAETVALTGAAAALDVAGSLDVTGTLTDQNDNSIYADYLGVTGLNATGTGSVVINDLILGTYGLVSVGAMASIEIGSGGNGVAGDFMIDAGATLTATATIATQAAIRDETLVVNGVLDSLAMQNLGELDGRGTIVVEAGGDFANYGELTSGSALTFIVNAGATLALPFQVGAGNSVTLAGANANVSFTNVATIQSATFDVEAPIIGFAYGDTINVEVLGSVAEGRYALGTGGVGTLTLLDAGGATLGTLRLIGDYSASHFVVSPTSPEDFTGDGAVQINLAEPAAAAVSSGTTGHDDYDWSGPVGGAWNDPANWTDISSGATPSAIAPGANDLVTLSTGAVITGSGTADTLATNGAAFLAGTFSTGLVTLAGEVAMLQVDPGGTLSATGVMIAAAYGGDLVAAGAGARLTVQGILGLTTFSALDVVGGATALIGGIAFGADTAISLGDSFSELEIGTLGDGAAGTLSLDAGQVISPGSDSSFTAPVIALDARLVAASGDSLSGTLTGTGTLNVPAQISASVSGALAAASALTFTVGAGATLALPTAMPAATMITLNGTTDGLEFLSSTPPATLGVGATIAGLAYGDNLLVTTADPIAHAAYAGGALRLSDAGGSLVGALTLAGAFSTDVFLVAPLSADGTLAQIDIADANFPASPGSGGQHAYTWTGPSGGSFGDAADWQDETGGQISAAIAPGLGDNVTIAGDTGAAGTPALLVTGTGTVAALSLTGNVAFDGTVAAGAVSAANPTEITAGGTLLGSTLMLPDYYATIAAIGSGALLEITGVAVVAAYGASVVAAAGARVQLGGAELTYNGTLAVDDLYSVIEIGASGTGVAGALTIDPGSTLTGNQSQLVSPGIVVDGTLSSPGLNATGTLSGTGTVMVANQFGYFADFAPVLSGSLSFIVGGSYSSLALSTSVGAGNTIDLAGSFDMLTFGNESLPDGGPLAVAASIAGLQAGDTLVIDGASTIASAVFTQTSAHGGTLALSDGAGNLVGDLLLEGTYSSGEFVPSLGTNYAGTAAIVDDISVVACYAAGTRIATPGGPVPVETLAIGQPVVTVSGAARPVRWIGRRSYDGRFLAGNRDVLPILFRPGSLADGIPCRDLYVSPKHAMYIDGVLIPAELLVNGLSVVQLATVEMISYFHVELETHDIIVAEGAPSESFVDLDSRMMFQNAPDFLMLYPDAVRSGECASRIEDGEVLATVRRRIADRAALVAEHADDAVTKGELDGRIDVLDHRTVSGWAYDETRPHTPVRLEVEVDGACVGVCVANMFRGDLRDAGKGRGRCAYALRLPVPMAPHVDHQVSVRRIEDGALLPGGCRTLARHHDKRLSAV